MRELTPATQLPAPAHADGGRRPLDSRSRDDDTIGLADTLRAARRRWWLLALGALLGVAAAVAYVLLVVPVYESSASLRVDKKTGSLPEVYRDVSTKSDIRTEIEVLGSRTIAATVADSLGLRLRLESPRRALRRELVRDLRILPGAGAADYALVRQPDGRFRVVMESDSGRTDTSVVAAGAPATLAGMSLVLTPEAARHEEIRLRLEDPETTVKELRENVQIDLPDREADIIEISYRDADPRTARDVVDLWLRHFIGDRQSVQRTEARSTAAFLREQLDTLSAELATSEEAYAAFREQAQVVSPEVQASTQVTQLATLRAERNRTEAERSALASLLSDVESAAPDTSAGAPSPYRRLIAFPTLLRNQVTSELLRSLADVESQRATLLQRRTPTDPDVEILTARVRELEEQLRSIATTYLDGLTLQVASLDSAQRPYASALHDIPRNEMIASRLGRSPRVLESLVTMLQTRLKEAQIAEAVEDPSVRVIDAAVLPIRPVRPNLPFNLAFGLFAGLLAGGVSAYARERLDHAVHTRADVQWASGVPVIGVIPSVRRTRSGSAILQSRAKGRARFALPALAGAALGDGDGARHRKDGAASELMAASEAYARLQLSLAFSRGEVPARSILFASAAPGEGKTTSAVNFALTLARRGQRTILVDADLRRGAIASLLGEADEPGVADVLEGRVTAAHATRTIELEAGATLSYLARGFTHGNSGRLLDSPRLGALLAELATAYDRVVLDSPPLNLITDAALLSAHVEGVVVVARAGKTDPEALAAAIEQLRLVHAPLLGTLLNDADPARDRGYGASHRYYGQTTPA